MSATPGQPLLRVLRAGLPVLAVALGAALSAQTALAGNSVQLDGAGLAAAWTDKGVAADPAVQRPSKLTLGLDGLSAEYQDYRQAVTQGLAPPGAFTSTNGMARLIGDTVAVDAVAADDAQALKTALEALGAEVSAVAGRIVSARIPLDRLPSLEGIETLQFARPVLAITQSGAVTSQGDTAQRSHLVRSELGLDGSGSVVGVLSDSFDSLKTPGKDYVNDVATGDLPAGVNILADLSSSQCDAYECKDEGRAMAQIIHDVAPGATLSFHTAYRGQADFAKGIEALAAAGARIIVDDVFYIAEPMFQDGVIAQAVDAVRAQGIAYFSAAGNRGRQAYQAPFRDSGVDAYGGGRLHDFDPGPGISTRLRIRQYSDTRYLLQWQDRYFSVSGLPGASSNLDICVYLLERPVPSCTWDINTGADPIDGIGVAFSGSAGPPWDIEIAVAKRSGPAPNLVKIVAFGTNSMTFLDTYDGTNAGTIYGHANAAGANAVGASAFYLTPAFGTTPPVLNDFSSAGNTPILFDTAGNPVSQTRQKPEFTAPDGGNTTFFDTDSNRDTDSFPNFFGTSAAAPHAAGVAALLREAVPTLTPDQITTRLKGTAIDMLQRNTAASRVAIGAGYDNDSGAGLIDASAAARGQKSNTATALTSSLNPAAFGQSVCWTASVSPSTATGTVTFTDSAAILGTAALAGGIAAYSTASLAVGNHSITATYAGDANYNGSSGGLTQSVTKANSNTTLTSSLNPAPFGQSVTFIATVSPASANGMVTFKDGTATLGTAPLSGGNAAYSTSTLPVGSHSITAVYGSDANYNGSTSPPLGQRVNKGSSTAALACAPNPASAGQSVTCTATVSPGSATGTVTFKDGTRTLGTATLSRGSAVYSTATLATGRHGITAVYGGDTSYNGSTSPAVIVTVKPITTTSLVSSLNPAAVRRPVTFTASVSSATASGTVTFKDGTATLGTASLSGGKASLTAASLGIGSHPITAVYAGDAGHAGSTSVVLMQVVQKDSAAAWLPAVLGLILE